MNKLFIATLIFATASFAANADVLTAEGSLEVINKGTVISSFVGDGSSARGNKQAIYVLNDGALFFCNLYTQKLRGTAEAAVNVECFKTSN
jgi:hypothetical protein